jgi:peptidoglycan hydrolase FlgJ
MDSTSSLPLQADISQAADMAVQPRSLPKTASTPAEAMRVGREFESVFVGEMLKEMFSGVKTDGWFGGGEGEEMFRSLLLDSYGKMLANHGRGVGIAQAVAQTLLRTQEVHG